MVEVAKYGSIVVLVSLPILVYLWDRSMRRAARKSREVPRSAIEWSDGVQMGPEIELGE
jgi:hypothetical protein